MKTTVMSAKKALIVNILIIGLSVSAFIATDLYLPSFPSMVQHYQVPAGSIQLSVSLFILTLAISQFIGGLLSDRFGRRPVLLVGLSVFVLGSVLLVVTHSLTGLYIGRLVQGLGVGAAAVIARVLLSDLYRGKNLAKVFSMVASVIVIAPAVAPFFGGLLQAHFDYQGSFYAMLIYGAVLLLLVACLMPETNHALERDATKSDYLLKKIKEISVTPKFMWLVLSNGLIFSMVMAYSMVGPFIFQTHYGFSALDYGALLLFISGGLVVGMLLNRMMLNRFSPVQTVFVGLSVALLVNISIFSAILLGVSSAWMLASQLFVMNICVGLILPNNAGMIFNLFSSSAGMVGAIYGSLRMVVVTLIGVLISALHMVSPMNLAVLLLLINFTAVTFYYISCNLKSAKIPSPPQ